MGSSKDVMELFAERDLRRVFPAYDSWEITPVNTRSDAGLFYRVSRKKMYTREVAFVAVSFRRTPDERVVSALDALPVSGELKAEKYLITPQAADTAAIPSGIKVLPMNAYAFEQGNLVWMTKKKNVKKFPEQAVAT